MASDFVRSSASRQPEPASTQPPTTTAPSSSAEPKISRYRSVRRSQHRRQLQNQQLDAQSPASELPQSPDPPAVTSPGITRAMSRYRKDRSTPSAGATAGIAPNGSRQSPLASTVPPVPIATNSPAREQKQQQRHDPSSPQAKQQVSQFQLQQQQQLEKLKSSARQQLRKDEERTNRLASRSRRPTGPSDPNMASPPPRELRPAFESPVSKMVRSPTDPTVTSPVRSTQNINRPQRSATDTPIMSPKEEAKRVIDGEMERHKRMRAKIRAEQKARLEAEERERAAKEEEERLELERQQAEVREAERLEREKKEEEERQRLAKLREVEAERQRERAKKEEERRRRQEEKLQLEQQRRREKDERRREAAEQRGPAPGGALGMFRRREPPSSAPASHTIGGIVPGGGSEALPGADAPLSAVNAGDRRVKIECNSSSISLPVSTTTTPVDLVRSAANVLSEPINSSRAILLESFNKAGIQRPLRMYEQVRHVLNSWDDDNQNSLILVDAVANADSELTAASVPPQRPGEKSFWMHYSQRPGRWSKRYFILQPDGQILQTKSESNKEYSTVCHLSDFDIYTPTPKATSRKVKPPKKICFAIKSQQKSNMFEASANFVHFFATSDREVGTAFYQAVQGWRSWYLLNIMGEGQPSKLSGEVSRGDRPSSNDQNGGLSNHRKAKESVDSNYQLGSFKPLMDMDAFSSDLDASLAPLISIGEPQNASRAMHNRKMSSRTKGAPPVSYPAGRDPEPTAAGRPSISDDDNSFNATGLLGRTYSQRQRIQREREAKESEPFLGGLLGNEPTPSHGLTRSSSNRRTSNDLARSSSNARRQMTMPKPLVDLTPKYQEPLQHSRKGRGFHPETVGAGGLVDSATTQEQAINIPPSHEWRRPSNTGGTSGIERNRAVRASGGRLAAAATNINPHAVPESSSEAFTGGGLMGTRAATGGFGAQTTGRGIMSGSNATGPMLNMREGSNFAPGSLLSRVETEQGPSAPIIDRSKRNTVEIGTGERA